MLGRCGVGSSVLPCNVSDGCVPHRLGSGHEDGHPARGLWSGRHLTWHINWLEMLAVFRALKHFLSDLRDRQVLVRVPTTQRWSLTSTTNGVCIHYRLAYTDPWVVPGQTPHAESSSHSWACQYGSGHPVKAQGMDSSPQGSEADLESDWPGTGGPLRYSGDSAISPLVPSN